MLLMTDATRSADPLADAAPDLSTVIQRRLVGLLVLLAGVFLLSLLLRNAAQSPEALPSVVIPLGVGGSGESRSSLDAEPAAVASQPESAESEASTLPPGGREATEASVPEPQESAAAVLPPVPAKKPKPRADPPPRQPAMAAKPAAAKPAATKPEAAARWFVAVGAYKDPMAAQAIANRVKLAGFKAEVSAVTVNKDKLQRVRAGPFATQAAAESARVTLIVEGLTKAVTLSEK